MDPKREEPEWLSPKVTPPFGGLGAIVGRKDRMRGRGRRVEPSAAKGPPTPLRVPGPGLASSLPQGEPAARRHDGIELRRRPASARLRPRRGAAALLLAGGEILGIRRRRRLRNSRGDAVPRP